MNFASRRPVKSLLFFDLLERRIRFRVISPFLNNTLWITRTKYALRAVICLQWCYTFYIRKFKVLVHYVRYGQLVCYMIITIKQRCVQMENLHFEVTHGKTIWLIIICVYFTHHHGLRGRSNRGFAEGGDWCFIRIVRHKEHTLGSQSGEGKAGV